MKVLMTLVVSLVLVGSAAADDCVGKSTMIGLFNGQLEAAEARIEAQSIQYATQIAQPGSCEADAVAALRTEIENGMGFAGAVLSVADDEAFLGCPAREGLMPVIEDARIAQRNLTNAWQRFSVPSVAELTRSGCDEPAEETPRKKTKVK